MECDLDAYAIEELRTAILERYSEGDFIPQGIGYLLDLLENHDGTIHINKV